MRSLLTAGAGLAFALASFASPVAFAEDEPAEPAAVPVVEGVRWVHGWAAGREEAAHTGRLMLVYVYRTSPH